MLYFSVEIVMSLPDSQSFDLKQKYILQLQTEQSFCPHWKLKYRLQGGETGNLQSDTHFSSAQIQL
jgi:hypothetical protein